jgi:hypothetical protein
MKQRKHVPPVVPPTVAPLRRRPVNAVPQLPERQERMIRSGQHGESGRLMLHHGSGNGLSDDEGIDEHEQSHVRGRGAVQVRDAEGVNPDVGKIQVRDGQ